MTKQNHSINLGMCDNLYPGGDIDCRRFWQNRLVLLWLLLISLFLLQQASAEYVWEPLVFPGLDEPVVEMTFIPPQTYYVLTPSGLKKSFDGGLSWRKMDLILPPLPGGRPQEIKHIAIARSNPNVIYANNIYRSADGGAHWEKIMPDIRLSGEWFQLGPLAVSPFDENYLALNYDGPTGTGCLLFSENGGKQWRCFGSYSYQDLFFIHPGTGEMYYRGNDGRFAELFWVDFKNREVRKIFSESDFFGYGFGFSSDDGKLAYFVYRTALPTKHLSTKQIYIRMKWNQQLMPLFPTENEIPDSVAFHAESETLFLSIYQDRPGIARVMRTEAFRKTGNILLRKNMGATWTECGQIPAGSQLFFLPGNNALYAQSRERIWQLKLLTSVSPGGQLATTWGELKRQ